MADWNCPDCGWVNRDFAEACLSCGAAHPGEGEMVAIARQRSIGQRDAQGSPATPPSMPPATWDASPAMPMTLDGALVAGAAEPVQASGEPFGIIGLSTGIVGAIVAAVVGSAIWYAVVAFTSYQIGYVAAAVGWLVGTGAVMGARGRGSVWLAGASVIVTVLALAVSEYLIAYHLATRDLGITFGLLQPPDVMLDIVLAVLQEDPATLLFWAFAIGIAAYIPYKAINLAPADQTSVPDHSPEA